MNFYTRAGMLYIDYKEGRERKRISTGLKDSAKAREFVLLNKEDFLQKQKAKTKKDLLLSELIALILAKAEGLKRTTRISYEARLKFLFNAMCGKASDMKVKDLEQEHVARVYEAMIAKNYAKSHIRTELRILRLILNEALERGLIAKSPFFKQNITTAKPKQEIKPFSLDEVQKIVSNCADLEFKTYLITAFFTGMRCGELMALKWENIDFSNDEIQIDKAFNHLGDLQSPKTTNSKRTIDMLPIVKNALLDFRAKALDSSEFVFLESLQEARAKFKRRRKLWYALLQELGLEKRVIYNTRHTFASIMLNERENPLWVGCKMLGHKDLSITYANYARYIIDKKQNRAAFLNDFKL